MLKSILRPAAMAAALASFATSAGAVEVEFVFKGEGQTAVALGLDNVHFDVGCAGDGSAADVCIIDTPSGNAAGLNYNVGGAGLNVKDYAGIGAGLSSANSGEITRVIQDIYPSDSGLGAFSRQSPHGETKSDDQTQFGSGETVKFSFDRTVELSDIEFNAGVDGDCGVAKGDGDCAVFNLFVDSAFVAAVASATTTNLLAAGGAIWTGNIFEFLANQLGAGFAVARFEVTEAPTPGALPLLLSGIAGLGFAMRSRRYKRPKIVARTATLRR